MYDTSYWNAGRRIIIRGRVFSMLKADSTLWTALNSFATESMVNPDCRGRKGVERAYL